MLVRRPPCAVPKPPRSRVRGRACRTARSHRLPAPSWGCRPPYEAVIWHKHLDAFRNWAPGISSVRRDLTGRQRRRLRCGDAGPERWDAIKGVLRAAAAPRPCPPCLRTGLRRRGRPLRILGATAPPAWLPAVASTGKATTRAMSDRSSDTVSYSSSGRARRLHMPAVFRTMRVIQVQKAASPQNM